jgi:hypothetical protein
MDTQPGEWVKLVGDNGAMVVITGVVIMLVTWGAIYTVIKLFGKNGLIPWAFDRLFGDDGYVDRVVNEHTGFVQSVKLVNEKSVERQETTEQQIRLLADKTEEIRTATLGEALAASTLQKHFRDSHDFNVAVVEAGVDMAERAAEKADMKDDLQEYIEKIRYLIASKSAVRNSDSVHG